MKAKYLPLFVPALAVALAIAVPVNAKGAFDSILVYGEGEAIQVADPSLLTFDTFNDFSSPYPGTPSVTTAGLLIVRGGTDSTTGQFVPIDSLRFFQTSLGTGSPPVVFYEGLVNGWSEYDKKWYVAKPEAAGALQEALSSGAGTPSAPQTLLFVALSAIAGFALGIGTKVLARRPDQSRLPPIASA